MTNYEERIKAYKELLYENYDLVHELENNMIPGFKKLTRILYDPKDDQELQIAESYIYRLIIKWAIDNGVYKQKNIESNESLNVIIDYALNSTKSIFERRSLQSFVEKRFETLTPEIRAKIMYQICTIPKEQELSKYINKVIREQEIEMTKYKNKKFQIAATNALKKLSSLVPGVFTEQDNRNYEIYSRTFINLCEEGLKDNIKEYWNNDLSNLDYEDTQRIYNSISEVNKEKLANLDPESIQALVIINFLSSNNLDNSIINIPLQEINRIAEESSVPRDELRHLVIKGIFCRKPIVETWFELESLENSFNKPTNKYPSYIAKYLKEAMRESKAKKEDKEKPKEFLRK